MACILHDSPEFKAMLEKVGGNHLLAEIALSKALKDSEIATPVVETISNVEIANLYYSKLQPKISFEDFMKSSRYKADILLRLGISKSEVLDSLKCK